MKFDRRYRNYILRWFLAIGLAFMLLAGSYFYHVIQQYLAAELKQSQARHLSSLSYLLTQAHLNAAPHSQLQLRKSMLEVAANNPHLSRLFLLNYDNQKQQFSYALDPQQAANDSLLIMTPSIELIVEKLPNQQIKLSRQSIQQEEVESIQNQRRLAFKLEKTNQTDDLLVNEKKLFEFDPAIQWNVDYLLNTALVKPDPLNKLLTDTKLFESSGSLSYRFIKKGQALHLANDFFPLGAQEKQLLINLLANHKTKNEITLETENYGSLIFSPRFNQNNQLTGFLVGQISPQALGQLRLAIAEKLLPAFAGLMIGFLLVGIFFSRKISEPVEQLYFAIARLIHNDFNFKLSAAKFGSFTFLAKQFNLMLNRIQSSRNELIHLNKSYSRFVPHQLLKLLNATSVKEISLGDSFESEMTILFCDIRGFTTLSETMSPSANFKFINRYLNLIAPVINSHGGIIDKYLGDGIMALFPNKADDALIAAIDMLEALKIYNRKLIHQKLPIIEVGIGLHTGKTMLGTVGTPSRMDATVISDSVNAAARIEALTKSFCTNILISEETKLQLKQLARYRIRYIAECNIQGKSKPVILYEVFDNDPVSLQKEKADNQTNMIKAWRRYKDGETEVAVNMYRKLIEKSPNDKSLFALIERCQSGRL